ncbi:DEBR0S3_13740g1_1 [Brettanomyces bruxellensis]|uniref:DEBR0S3_13740g1_1 n=1 Tax=Dekkera bruxellensis TaxID=5007 RepID=A0A7D9H0B1_DEKBR|nr:DEBR0S3_13740g1_1 [Brettanomyces bruxellensis]
MKPLTADGIQHQKNAQSGRSLAQQSAMDLLGLTRTFESSNHSSPRTKSPTSATDADFEAAYLLMTSDPLKSSSFASLGIPSAATPPNFDDLVRTRFSPQRETDTYPFPAHSARSVAYNSQPVGSNGSSVHTLSNSQEGPTGSIEKQHLNAGLAEQSVPNPVQGTNYSPQIQQIPTSNYHTPPPISPVPPTTSTVSPNTRVLLKTFNNLNYSVSSKTAMNDWGASNQQYSQLAPNNSAPPSGNATGHSVSNILGQSQWGNHPEMANSSGQSTELLSMTETSALENFLDSIASDVSFDKLAKQWSSIDPGSSANSLREQMQDGTAARISIQPTQRQDVGEKSIPPGRIWWKTGR